jgi:F-type H+-transporting ATPase subunit b
LTLVFGCDNFFKLSRTNHLYLVNRTRGDSMIDINVSLFIQIVNFIILLIALNFLLFKPIRKIMQEREQGISSALEDAKAAQNRMQSLLEQYNASLAESKQKAATAYNSIYQQGLDTQRDTISAERTKAGEMLDKARAEIAAAAGAARAELKKEAERLSQEITSKLIGRAV